MATRATNAGTRNTKKKTAKQTLADRRKVRGDLGAMRDVMRTPEIEGYVVRWVNQEVKSGVNRVARLKSLGWELYDGESTEVDAPTNVTEANISLGSGTTLAVGTDRENRPMTAVLMMIPEEIYAADQTLKEEEILAKEEDILNQGQDDDGMYGGVRVGRQ